MALGLVLGAGGVYVWETRATWQDWIWSFVFSWLDDTHRDHHRPVVGKPIAKLDDSTFFSSIIRSNILDLTPYRCARDDFDSGILLDANENSFGPALSPPVFQYYHTLQLERYPCPYQKQLKEVIAACRNRENLTSLEEEETRKLSPAQIFLGVGSDEAIDLLIRITCVPSSRDQILITSPTYGMYSVSAKINNVGIVDIPLRPDFQLDIPAMINSSQRGCIKLIFLCNPGNPTAQRLHSEDIDQILQHFPNSLVVVDEAYIDFSAPGSSSVKLLSKYRHLVVLQTLSKAFGLAGIRLGMALGHDHLITIMNNVKAPYNINKVSANIALDALAQAQAFHATLEVIASEKYRVAQALVSRTSVVRRVLPSDTNFLVFEIPEVAFEIYQTMATEEGVVIRYRGNCIHLRDCLRVTIGTPEENDAMLRALDRACAKCIIR